MYAVEIPTRMDTLHEYRQSGGKIAAVLPIHYPRELLRTFNLLPVEVWGPPSTDSTLGESHLQPYVCSIVRNALSFIQSGGLADVDLLLVPHTCDSLQGLGSLLTDFIPTSQPVLTLYLPRGKRHSDLDFLEGEFQRLYARLADITGHTPSESELLASIQREEAADTQLALLYQERHRLPLGDLSFYRFIRSREYLPAEQFIILAQTVLSLSAGTERVGTSLLLSGILPEPMDLFNALTEMGACVVGDDFASCGRRLYPAGQSGSPFRRMAERIVHASPDPTRGSAIPERLQHLLNLAKASRAKGVVFYNVKFCEPELFELPQIRRGLQAAEIPSITVEVDIGEGLSQPVLNRLAAFVELLQ